MGRSVTVPAASWFDRLGYACLLDLAQGRSIGCTAIHEPAFRRQYIGPALETKRTRDWQAYTLVNAGAGSVTGDASQKA